MGASTSKRPRDSPFAGFSSYSLPHPKYAPPSYVPRQQFAPWSPRYGEGGDGGGVDWDPELKKKPGKKYSKIGDNYKSLEQVTEALRAAGLESSNLIVGVDFTKSNEWTGTKSFQRRSLHHLGDELNPYEQAISIVGKTLSSFDDDNLIPCFGFGDASTHDQEVFSFYADDRVCHGFEEVLKRYRELVPQLRLAGPTSFAPIIEMAITIVERSGGQYHVLLIIADGQVTRSVDTDHGQLSLQERKTIDAIVKASKYPLSIVFVGVGDGPWDVMREFDDNIPARAFDNFQFVNFTHIMSKKVDRSRKEAEFALAALMEIPFQYKATLEFNILGASRGKAIDRVSLPPPCYGATSSNASEASSSGILLQTEPSLLDFGATPESCTYDNDLCPICLFNRKNMAFGCGHRTCCGCGEGLELCPNCKVIIQTRIKLY